MADDITLPGTGGVIATDDISSKHYQRIKLIHGADGTNDGDVSNTNGLPVTSKGGFVSTNNSTTSTLTSGSVFTGTGDDVTHYSSVAVSWNADVAAASGGLSMQFSTDNSNWDRKIPVDSHSDSLQANHGGVHRLAIIAKYFRIVYTNGTTNQANFRLQAIYHSDNSMPLISRMQQQINTTSDVTLVRDSVPIDLDLARKQITGQRAFFFFGFNNSVGTSYEDVWPNGGDIPWPTTAAKVEVLSSHADDTSAGIGVRKVEIHGLSATGVDQDEVITMNGTSAVESSLTYIRVNKMHNETVGTYGGSHKGDITCRVTGGGHTLSMMTGVEGSVDISVQYGSGEAGNGYWSVPLGKVLYITRIQVIPNVSSNKTMDVVLYEREGILNTSAPYDPRRVIWGAGEFTDTIDREFKSHIKIKALTDLWFRAKGSATSKLEVSLDFYLLDQNASGA